MGESKEPDDKENEEQVAYCEHRYFFAYELSHRVSTGITMTMERRLALLEWAALTGAYVLEVDYDSDFRYEGPILPSLQWLDRSGCVIDLNSF